MKPFGSNLRDTIGPFFTGDISACHSRKITGINNKISDPGILVLYTQAHCHTFTGTLELNGAIVNAVGSTCAFPPVTKV